MGGATARPAVQRLESLRGRGARGASGAPRAASKFIPRAGRRTAEEREQAAREEAERLRISAKLEGGERGRGRGRGGARGRGGRGRGDAMGRMDDRDRVIGRASGPFAQAPEVGGEFLRDLGG